MSQTRPKKQRTPLNADTFNLIPDLATLADTSGVIVSVANQAEGDAIAAALATAGFPVTDASPLYCWDLSQNSLIVKGGSGWRGGTKPFGHMGRTAGFQTVVAGGAVVVMDAAQELRGGVTFDNATDSLVLPLSGYYRLSWRGYLTGGSAYTGFVKGQRNLLDIAGSFTATYKANADDYIAVSSVVKNYTAGDKINVVVGGSSTWGTSGYDGTFVEVEYMDQW